MKLIIFRLFLLTACCAAVIAALLRWVPDYNPGNWVWIGLIFFFLLTLVLYKLVDRSLNAKQSTFSTALFGGMLIRFLFSIFFLVIYLIINKEKNLSFILTFLFLYLLFTIFEIVHLVRKLRLEKSRGFDTTSS